MNEYTLDDVLGLKRKAMGSLRNRQRYMAPRFAKTVDRFQVVLDDVLEDMASGGLDYELRDDAIPIESKVKCFEWLVDFMMFERVYCENERVKTEYGKAISLCKLLVLDYMFLEMATNI